MEQTKTTAPLMMSVSGVRGIIGASLTPEVACSFGQAFGQFLQTSTGNPRPTVAIGRDTRPSGPMVLGAVTAGLMSVGANVVDLGVATTPSVALLGRFIKSDASMIITASHNPLIWNGIKTVRADGIAFPPEQAAEIKRGFQARTWSLADMDHLGTFATDSRAHAHHVQTVLALVDTRAIADQRFRVVLDSVNGAGCIPTPMLLSKLGVELVHLNGEATGHFAHIPEPTRENLTDLAATISGKRAAIGFAQDPDADRLAIVDERGTYIGEEYTLALCTLARLMNKKGPVVTNLSTSRMVDDIAATFGCTVYRTPVGEANVAGKMQDVNAVIGGEGNGGVIDLRVGPVRDSLLGIALVLDMMTRTAKRLSELVAQIPAYAMLKTKFECTPGESTRLVERVKKEFADQKLDTQDGVRIDWPDGWVHVRQSNTEPIARVIAEAKDAATAQSLVARVEKLRSK
jgi:phosphomannomutase